MQVQWLAAGRHLEGLGGLGTAPSTSGYSEVLLHTYIIDATYTTLLDRSSVSK